MTSNTPTVSDAEIETETLKWHKSNMFETLRRMLYPPVGEDRTISATCGGYRIENDPHHGICLSQSSAKHVLAEYDALSATERQLRTALEPFAKAADWFNENAHDDSWTIYARNGKVYLTVGHLRRARAALSTLPSPDGERND